MATGAAVSSRITLPGYGVGQTPTTSTVNSIPVRTTPITAAVPARSQNVTNTVTGGQVAPNTNTPSTPGDTVVSNGSVYNGVAPPNLYYDNSPVVWTASDTPSGPGYSAPIGSQYQLQYDPLNQKYSFSDPYTGESQFNVGNTGWVTSPAVAIQNFETDFGLPGGFIDTYSITSSLTPTAPASTPVASTPVASTPPPTTTTTPTAPATPAATPPTTTTTPTTPGSNGTPTGNAPDPITNPTNPTLSPNSTYDPVLSSLLQALSGQTANGTSGTGAAGGVASLPPSTVLPTDTSGSTTSTSSTDIIVLGIIASLIAAAIWYFVIKHKSLKDLEHVF